MDIYNHNQSLGHLTGLASRLFNKLLSQRLQQAGIDMTAEQWGVILVLLNSDALTQGQIGEQLYLEKSSISRSIDGLEKRGWIERQRSETDSRQKMVILTDKAMDIAQQGAAIAQSVLEDAQKDLAESDIKTNQAHLLGIIANLRQLNAC